MSDHKPCPYPDGDDGLLEYGLWQLEKSGLSSQNVSPEMMAKLANKHTRQPQQRNIVEPKDALIPPDIICSFEYRTIYDAVIDTVADCEPEDRYDMAKAMLEEFVDQAKAARKRLKKMRKIDKLKTSKEQEKDRF